MNAHLTCAALALAVLSTVAPASSATINVTYTGVIRSGLDVTGVFGPTNTDLTGDGYVANYIFDTGIGQIFDTPIYKNVVGGPISFVFQPTPSLGSVITINNHSFTIAGTAFGNLYAQTENGSTKIYHDARDYQVIDSVTAMYNIFWNTVTSALLTNSLTEPFTSSIFTVNKDEGAGSLSIQTHSNLAGDLIYAYATFSPATVSVQIVPIPPAILLFGTALAGLGIFVRRHKDAPLMI
jgi:hypothetical protein